MSLPLPIVSAYYFPKQWLLLFAVLSFSFFGCASITAGFASVDGVEKAYQEKDASYLKKVCAFKKRNIMNGDSHKKACQRLSELERNQKEQAVLDKIAQYEKDKNYKALNMACSAKSEEISSNYSDQSCAARDRVLWELYEKEASSCSGVLSAFKTYSKTGSHGKSIEKKIFLDAGAKLAKCGKWDYVFTNMIHYGQFGRNATGYDLIEFLDKKKFSVEKEFLTFLAKNKSRPLRFDHSEYAASHFVTWLIDKKRFSKCSKFVPYAEKMNSLVVYDFLGYFSKAKCKPAVPLATRYLSHQKAELRNQACNLLGEIGNKSHIKKLQTLANTDSAYRLDKSVFPAIKVYYVQDTCKAAMGKISLRN